MAICCIQFIVKDKILFFKNFIVHIYHIFLIKSLINGYQGWSQNLTIAGWAAINLGIHITLSCANNSFRSLGNFYTVQSMYVCMFQSQKERKREQRSPFCWFNLQVPRENEPGKSWAPRTQSGFPMWVARTQTLESSLLPPMVHFQDAGIGSRTRTWTQTLQQGVWVSQMMN